RVQLAQKRDVALVVEALDRADLAAFSAAHADHGAIRGRIVLPLRAALHDVRELAPELRVTLAVPDLAQRALENITERTALQDAARRDGTAGPNHHRMPSDEARLFESRRFLLDASRNRDFSSVRQLVAPRDIASRDE